MTALSLSWVAPPLFWQAANLLVPLGEISGYLRPEKDFSLWRIIFTILHLSAPGHRTRLFLSLSGALQGVGGQ